MSWAWSDQPLFKGWSNLKDIQQLREFHSLLEQLNQIKQDRDQVDKGLVVPKSSTGAGV